MKIITHKRQSCPSKLSAASAPRKIQAEVQVLRLHLLSAYSRKTSQYLSHWCSFLGQWQWLGRTRHNNTIQGKHTLYWKVSYLTHVHQMMRLIWKRCQELQADSLRTIKNGRKDGAIFLRWVLQDIFRRLQFHSLWVWLPRLDFEILSSEEPVQKVVLSHRCILPKIYAGQS